jgi:hypothetical protein
MIKSFMGDSLGGDLLRVAGVEMPPRRSDLETLKENIVDFGMPNLPVGQIKRLSHAIRKGSPEGKKLREVMSKEMGLRGKADQDDYIDSLLRSTPFHGRGYEHYPQTGELYNTGFGKPGNIGEPQGLSLTYREPKKFVREHSSFAKRPKKYLNAATRLNRAMDKAPDVAVKELDGILSKMVKDRSSLKNTMVPGAEGAFNPELVDKLNKLDAQIDTMRDLRDFTAKNSTKAIIGRKQEEYFNKGHKDPAPISRVFPRFHGRPSEKIVKGWSGSGDEGVLQEAYTYALKQMPEIWRGGKPRIDFDNPSINKMYKEMKENPAIIDLSKKVAEGKISATKQKYWDALDDAYPDWDNVSEKQVDDLLKYIGEETSPYVNAEPLLPSYQGIKASMNGRAKQEFNTHLSDYLRSKGYRGILYSPQRYGEYEMRMLDPRDVVQQDIRQVDDPALERLYKGNRKVPEMSDPDRLKMYITEGKRPSAPTTSKKADTIKEWQARSDYEANPYQESGHSPYALGSIYSDIDMSALRLDPDDVRRAAREQVKMGVLAQEEATLADGLSLGKLGDQRVREDDVPIFTKTPEPAMEYDKMLEDIGISKAEFPWEDDAAEVLEKTLGISKKTEKLSEFEQDLADYTAIYGNDAEAWEKHLKNKKYTDSKSIQQYYDAKNLMENPEAQY